MINQALFCNFSAGQKDNCQTVEGKNCVFPFVYNGNTYNGCTTDESFNGLAWCATSVDRNRNVYHESWGDCVSSCPEGYLGWNHLLTNFIKTRGDRFQKGVLTTFWPIIKIFVFSPILPKLTKFLTNPPENG